MSQEKATIHPLFAVPKQKAEDELERDFYAELDERREHAEEEEICPLCYGSGMEIIPGKGARPCACRRQRSHTNLLDKARIPKRYADCHFQSYATTNRWQERAYGKATKLALNYPNVERGLLLMGSVGVGKTHLAVSILKALIERRISCLFYEFGSLLKSIQDSYNAISKTSELKILEPILESEILVLDEIGASKPTDWVRDTMAHIINARYNDKKLTIFTTNYLDERRSERDETLEDRIGVRLRSRLYEMCETVLIHGDDFRKNFDKTIKPVEK